MNRQPSLQWQLALPIGAAGLGLLWLALRPRTAPGPRWWQEMLPHLESRAWERHAPQRFVPLVYQVAQETGVPPALLAALIRTESAWNPSAVSKAGAQGLTQLMPATAREVGVTDSFDPLQAMRGGATYLRRQLDRFDSVAYALAAYNAGPHRVEQYRGIPPFDETKKYVARILERITTG